MTYSSWGNAGRPCARQSCKCLQYRLGPSSEGLRERASSYQSDNAPDSSDPRTRRVNEVGFAERLALGGLHMEVVPIYPGRKPAHRTDDIGFPRSVIPTRSAMA